MITIPDDLVQLSIKSFEDAKQGGASDDAAWKYALGVSAASIQTTGWRCFHCDEMFVDQEEALKHFGTGSYCEPEPPACKLNQLEGGILALYREALGELKTWQTESDAQMRLLYSLGSEHYTKVIRAEEEGYAKGMAETRGDIEFMRDEIVAHLSKMLNADVLNEKLRDALWMVKAIRKPS